MTKRVSFNLEPVVIKTEGVPMSWVYNAIWDIIPDFKRGVTNLNRDGYKVKVVQGVDGLYLHVAA